MLCPRCVVDAGIGILNLEDNTVHLLPSSHLDNPGHPELLEVLNLESADVRGFVVVKQDGQFFAENFSGQNINKPGSNGHQMASDLFESIVATLESSGL